MEKLKQYKYIIVIALIILGGLFYWYSYRPAQIRKLCANGGIIGTSGLSKAIIEATKVTETEYTRCLRKHGLNN